MEEVKIEPLLLNTDDMHLAELVRKMETMKERFLNQLRQELQGIIEENHALQGDTEKGNGEEIIT